MITLEKIKTLICFNFISWMLFTSLYTWFMLGLKHQSLPLLANMSFLTEDREIKLFQRERGGVRRIGSNSARNITKATLSKTV
ncbi:hypothetical protein Ava_B0203 (plasmid) [Trichormus variabilis ATCC 29413]|uniref:Uncharacterized protein n=2 Tax=Anabaena variabilis TaxID=264691 RepID=Q3M271_TRIV2|nr:MULTISPECIES: hypothetical protein [Nostocaceae]ABA24915.1 hypothetical protein Ava_B0203 [Trichormus variabilis ATCC 29413]MBC1217944.1 hypothetical protein [Trichormus variabilis ARAD]MBC1259186.1 hypothetical protein [Trichormus variabilis V5]MBC1270802.1 hypothetical protein [Trichormus variabilis FSR]MBC1305635.1 hypothetical protein [Trichormus variabilis N2B]